MELLKTKGDRSACCQLFGTPNSCVCEVIVFVSSSGYAKKKMCYRLKGNKTCKSPNVSSSNLLGDISFSEEETVFLPVHITGLQNALVFMCDPLVDSMAK